MQVFHARKRELLVPMINPEGTLTFASKPQGRAATGQKRPVNKVATQVLGRVDEFCQDCCGRGWKVCATTWPIYDTVIVTGAGILLSPTFDVPAKTIDELRAAAPDHPPLTAFDRAFDWLAGVPGRFRREGKPRAA